MKLEESNIETREPLAQVSPREGETPNREELRQKAGETAEKMRQAGADAAHEAAEQGAAFLDEQRTHAAEAIHHCSDALKTAANDLRQKHDPNLASYAQALAERLDQSSNYLRTRQFQGIREDVENFARKQPQIFYGGLFLAGLALSRFFKASAQTPPEGEREFTRRATEGAWTQPEPESPLVRPASADIPVI
jgi:hypothetical protein